jgi:hypothetical protein
MDASFGATSMPLGRVELASEGGSSVEAPQQEGVRSIPAVAIDPQTLQRAFKSKQWSNS